MNILTHTHFVLLMSSFDKHSFFLPNANNKSQMAGLFLQKKDSMIIMTFAMGAIEHDFAAGVLQIICKDFSPSRLR